MMPKLKFIQFNAQSDELICSGEWNVSNLAEIKKDFEALDWPKTGKLIINGKLIKKLDSGGAWLLNKWIAMMSKKNLKIEFEHFSEQYKKLLSFSQEQKKSPKDIPVEKKLGWLQELGKYSLAQANELNEYVNFIGELFFETLRTLRKLKNWRWNTIASVINSSGTSAIPIIALLSFMIGIVITYEIGTQLKTYGANIYIVNLIGYTILREFGPLMTAIIVASRTGSAITAQIGHMKINKEIDALNTMGITSDELLILPRIISLFIILPLLTFCADIFGVLGGLIMSKNVLDVTWYEFLTRFQNEIPVRSLIIGLGKTFVFAFIIASISCFQGMEVKGSSVSVGARTTRSVVMSIFFIIIVDAFFSILLSKFKL
jgi:phospholipid/cholesterol/gamma-HCH transport system permease protein